MTDAEVSEIAAEIRRSSRQPGYYSYLPLQKKLALEFGRRRGWTWRQHSYTAPQLHRKRPRYPDSLEYPPYYDHANGFLMDSRPVATVIQPYAFDAQRESAMRYYADKVGLIFSLPDFPSWWNPGHTTLCVFSVPPP